MRLSLSTAALAATLLSPALLLAQQQPQFFPNSVKYKDTSIPNATGRSGNASIEARALFNRDRTTDLELTTGNFDSNTAGPGTISHVQVQMPEAATLNFDGGANTFTKNISGLAPHQQVGVQTNVRDIDGARTDVVSVSETVKRRPDVRVVAVTAPSSAIRGYNVLVRATLSEANGDTGARADVRLYANDELADRAENIWINAGGTVDVTFAPTINMTGTVTLKVVADRTNPGDWDSSNNSDTTQIEMKDEVGEFYSWNASVREEDSTNYHYQKYSWGEFTDDQKGLNQIFQFTGVLRSEPEQTGLKASIKVTNDDGTTLFEGSKDDFWPPQHRWFGTCSESITYNPEVSVCYNENMQYTTVDIYAGASDVMYRSWGWATQRNPFSPPEPRFEWNTVYHEDSVKARFGNSVSMDVNFEANGSQWRAQPNIAVGAPETAGFDRPYSCYHDDFLNQDLCEEWHQHRVTRRGSAQGF